MLEKFENQNEIIENIRTTMIQPKKIQLHSGMEGFDSPEAFGMYRHTGGKPLGVVGKVFQPMDLNVLLDSIVLSVHECCDTKINMSKLTYNEYKGGSKIVFELPISENKEIKNSPMVGDMVYSSLMVTTGFDGLTKTSVSFIAYRLWCANGAMRKSAIDVSFKNTINNQAKVFYLCNELITCIKDVESYIEQLGIFVKKTVKQSEIDKYLTKVTGYNVKDYIDLTTRKRNILDRINESVAIEMENTGNNLFSLYNGITRYTTHELAKGEKEELLYSNANKINVSALEEAMIMLN
jgi:hypothetical protein